MQPLVVIDCFAECIQLYRTGYAIVAVDVIRATTSAVTVADMGQRCFPVPSLEAAWQLAATLDHPLLVGEIEGRKPKGFHMNNSPAQLAQRSDFSRPIVLLSSSGTRLICEAENSSPAYVACFRNFSAVGRVVRRYPRVAVIGAGSRGEFREEDQMCCAWVAAELIKAGHHPKDRRTAEIVARWAASPPSACLESKSVDYLRRSGQMDDLEFVVAHIDDVDAAFTVSNHEIKRLDTAEQEREAFIEVLPAS